MMPYFLDAYHDELLYSVLARVSDRLGYKNNKIVMEELFGTSKIAAIALLPRYLDRLVANLPPEFHYTADYLIDEHTLLPIFAPILSPERVSEVRRNMHGDGKTSLLLRVGLNRSGRTPRCLRYCPTCVIQDRLQYGEAYWHRLHQVSGVEACCFHQVFLEGSDVWLTRPRPNSSFSSLEGCLQRLPYGLPAARFCVHHALVLLARDAAWLLGAKLGGYSKEVLRQAYCVALYERGLATYPGMVTLDRVRTETQAFYAPEVLDILQCPLPPDPRVGWIHNALAKTMEGNPLVHHLLILQFLGMSAEEFFGRLPAHPVPFGAAPWPCLNPASDHFRQLTIDTCTVAINRHTTGQLPKGRFACHCGFVYWRHGPDSSTEDRWRYDWIECNGHVWEGELRRQWADFGLTQSDIGRNLGVTKATVKAHAARLGLVGRGLPSATAITGKLPDTPAKAGGGDNSIARDHRREEWLNAQQRNPEMNRTRLSAVLPTTYRWLFNHDTMWLANHCPARGTHGGPRSNWDERDRTLAAQVRRAGREILERPGKPERVSRSTLYRAIGDRTVLSGRPASLPLMCEALAAVVESSAEFAIRRINWVAHHYAQRCEMPSRSRLASEAGLNSLVMSREQIKRAVEEALEKLNHEVLAVH